MTTLPGDKHVSIQSAARDLLDALDRMHGCTSLSQNVIVARNELRHLLPYHRDPRDQTTDA